MYAIVILMMLAGDPATCPMHAQHTAVDQRGDQVMGFSHEKTKHSFRLLEDGGAIEVRANDAADAESIAAIRAHLQEIAREFAAGEFSKPGEIHGRVPDGVEVMKKEEISYAYDEIERGGRVQIRVRNARARDAVHAFLKFQIADHRTGDHTEMK